MLADGSSAPLRDRISAGYKVKCWYFPHLEMSGAGEPEPILGVATHSGLKLCQLLSQSLLSVAAVILIVVVLTRVIAVALVNSKLCAVT